MRKILLYLLALGLILTSCDPQNLNNKGVVVEVNGKQLKREDIIATLPENTSIIDSSLLVDEYVVSWVKHHLLLQKAQLNVDNTSEIDELITEYKEQLLIENYLRLLVEQKADIQPTEEQVLSFYEENKEHYKLSENLIMGIFVVIPLDASNIDILKSLLEANETDKVVIEAYCLQNAAKVDFFTQDWLPFKLIKRHLPELDKSEEQILNQQNLYEAEDSLFHYILKIENYKAIGNTSPLSYIYKELEEFLLNSNKITYLQKMEENLYDDAKRKGIVQFY